VVGESDGSGRALGAANRPELLETACALNRWGVGALVGVDIVNVTIGSDRALLGCASARILLEISYTVANWIDSARDEAYICAKVLDDVVFNQWVPL